jgi:hypothetical protein
MEFAIYEAELKEENRKKGNPRDWLGGVTRVSLATCAGSEYHGSRSLRKTLNIRQQYSSLVDRGGEI